MTLSTLLIILGMSGTLILQVGGMLIAFGMWRQQFKSLTEKVEKIDRKLNNGIGTTVVQLKERVNILGEHVGVSFE